MYFYMPRTNINLDVLQRVFITLCITLLLSMNSSKVYAQQSKSTDNSAFNTSNKLALDKAKKLLSDKDYQGAQLILNTLIKDLSEQQDNGMSAEIYFTSGKVYYKQKNFKKAESQFQAAANLIKGNDDDAQKFLALTYHEIAQCYKHLKDQAESIKYYQKALEIHTKRQDKKQIAQALKNIAMAENKRKNYIVALDHALQSLNILSTHGTPARYAQVALTTGIIYRNIGHYEKSLNYINLAKDKYEQEDSVRHLAEVDNQLGLIYTKLHQLDNAKDFYQQTIHLPVEKVKPETRAAAFRELGVIHYHQGDLQSSIGMLETARNIYLSINKGYKVTRVNLLLGQSYQKLKQPKLAIEYFEKSLAIATELAQTEFQVQALNSLGEIMLQQDISQAVKLLNQALALHPKVTNKQDKVTTYHWLKEAETTQGNLQNALRYSEKKYQLSQLIQEERDELEFTKNQVILASYKLEIEFNKLRENAEINNLKLVRQQNEISLMQQSQRISDLEIKKNRFANILLVTLLTIFILMVVYILYRYKTTQAKNKELDYLASKDPLTNCYNRRILYERFNQAFQNEETLTQYSVVLADIDSFKAINDNYGHSTGDIVLKGVAKVLLDNVSEFDTVARFGGEEFCILLPHLSANEAQDIAEKMRKGIESASFESLDVTCSFGVASLDKETRCDLTLIERADIALYQSKYDGRNRVTLWDFHTMEANRD